MPSTLQVVSQETIKPSSPTPPHLHTYKLSWLDQFVPVMTNQIYQFTKGQIRSKKRSRIGPKAKEQYIIELLPKANHHIKVDHNIKADR